MEPTRTHEPASTQEAVSTQEAINTHEAISTHESVNTQETESTQEPVGAPDPHDTMVRALMTARRNQFRAGLVLGILVTAAIVLLVVQNGKSARLNWLAFHFSSPLWIMLLLTAVAGAVAWEVTKAFVRRTRRLRRENRDAVRVAQELTRQ